MSNIDVHNLSKEDQHLSEPPEAPKHIWLNDMMSWSVRKMYDDDIKYIRAAALHACMEAGCSLNYHLFEIMDALKNESADFDEFEAMLVDAQPALDAWNRFLDEEE